MPASIGYSPTSRSAPSGTSSPRSLPLPGSDDVSLNALAWSDAGRPLVGLHGFGHSARVWDGVAQRMLDDRIADARFVEIADAGQPVMIDGPWASPGPCSRSSMTCRRNSGASRVRGR